VIVNIKIDIREIDYEHFKSWMVKK